MSGSGGSVPRTVRLVGELTIQTAAETRVTLVTALHAGGDVEIDLSGVTDLDTAGLQLLLLAGREAAHLGLDLRLTAAEQAVLDILRIVGLDRNLTTTELDGG